MRILRRLGPGDEDDFHLITQDVLAELEDLRRFRVGLAHVFILHTSASLSLPRPRRPSKIAAVSAWIMSVMGYEGEAQGTIILSSIGSLAIIRECTGVYPSAMYVSAVLAFPCNWRRKRPRR